MRWLARLLGWLREFSAPLDVLAPCERCERCGAETFGEDVVDEWDESGDYVRQVCHACGYERDEFEEWSR